MVCQGSGCFIQGHSGTGWKVELGTHPLITHWPEAASCIWAKVKEPRKATSCQFSPFVDFSLASLPEDTCLPLLPGAWWSCHHPASPVPPEPWRPLGRPGALLRGGHRAHFSRSLPVLAPAHLDNPCFTPTPCRPQPREPLELVRNRDHQNLMG